MKVFLKRSLVCVLLAVAMLAPAAAFADGSVHVALTAQRVSVTHGHETLVPAEKARPGDVLEYHAVYRNDGGKPVRDLVATLPIPGGLEYLPSTAAPAVMLASLDGAAFSPVPLMRKQRSADGHEVLREVPPSEYRALRWSLGTLGAGSSRTVSARARVAPLAVAALTR